jgi:hypothetical protein
MFPLSHLWGPGFEMEPPQAINVFGDARSTYELKGFENATEEALGSLRLARKVAVQIKLSIVFATVVAKADIRSHVISIVANLAGWGMKEAELGTAFQKRVLNAKKLR